MLGVVLICYKNPEEVVDYINNQLLKSLHQCCIVIVNNSLEPESDEILISSFKLEKQESHIYANNNLYLITALDNLGFAKANNLGANFLTSRCSIKYLLFSNTDIIIDSKDCFNKLIECLDEDKTRYVVGPKIIGNYGEFQNPYRFQSFLVRWIIIPLLYPIVVPIVNWIYPECVKKAKSGNYYRLMGCFMLFKSDKFYEIGMFDSRTFLYGEELFLAERILKSGGQSYYCDSIKIIHKHSETINKHVSINNQIIERYKSELLFYKSEYNINRVQVLFSKFALLIMTRVYIPLKTFIRF